jgi:hypothetical protein
MAENTKYVYYSIIAIVAVVAIFLLIILVNKKGTTNTSINTAGQAHQIAIPGMGICQKGAFTTAIAQPCKCMRSGVSTGSCDCKYAGRAC